MPSWRVPPPHLPKRCRDDVEADARLLMAKMASIEPRGFDSMRERAVLHRRIDQYLDEHAMFVDVERMTE